MTILRRFWMWALIFGALAPNGTSKSAPEPPFAINISSSPTGSVRVGTRIDIDVAMTNNSKITVTVHETNPATDYEIDVRDQANQPASLTKYGRILKGSATGTSITNRNLAVALKPGETVKEVIPLTDLYEMKGPSKYYVSIRRKFPHELGEHTAISNTVVIAMVDQG